MSQNSNLSIASFEPLPRGRHGLDTDELKATRRARLMQAMLELVSKKGYAATTVPDVVAAARVSRNAFYEFFLDKDACFLALCEEKAAELLELIMAYSATGDWLTALRRGMRDYLRWWQDRPELSHVFFVALPTLGIPALAMQHKIYEPFELMFRQIAAWVGHLNPQMRPTPVRVPRLLVISITEILADEVRAGRLSQLHELEDDLMFMAVRLLSDDAASPLYGPAPIAE